MCLAAGTTSGCGHSCTAKGCAAGVSVVFSRALDPSKSYTVDVVADATETRCTVSFNEAVTCGLLPVYTGTERTVTGTGIAYPANGFAGFEISHSPKSMRVAISDTSGLLATGDFKDVRYDGVEINGPGCGTCAESTVTLDVP